MSQSPHNSNPEPTRSPRRRGDQTLWLPLFLVAWILAAPASAEPQILFVSDRDGGLQLYRMDADGTNVIRLTNIQGDVRNPSVVPDNASVVLEVANGEGSDLFLFDLAARTMSRLTSIGSAGNPSWSPDGRWITFQSNRSGSSAIFRMNPQGAAVTPLSPDGVFDRDPAWSPGGKRIVFSSIQSAGEHILIMNADGTGRTQVTRGSSENACPSWTPDGQWILFNTSATGRHDAIAAIRPDGSDRRIIGEDDNLRTQYMDRNRASWRPRCSEQSRIVFTSLRSGNSKVYSMNLDGSKPSQLSTGTSQDLMPTWLSR